MAASELTEPTMDIEVPEEQSMPTEEGVHDYIDLKDMKDVENLERSQMLQYIEKLHIIIRKYDKKICKYKQKLQLLLNKEIKSYSEKFTQAGNVHVDIQDEAMKQSEQPENEEEAIDTDAFSFVNEMRQAAKHAENISNFVYEPTSGMYYDPKTGYYYNAEYGLYYDGNTGCYYRHDQEKDSYEFHSQAAVQLANANPEDGKASENTEADVDLDVVEFDEWGGVITDEAKLKQIKAEKEKIKKREAKSKRKSKKKHKKKSKTHKERRHKSKSKKRESRLDESAKGAAPKHRKRHDAEDGELSESSSKDSSSDSESVSGSDSEHEPVANTVERFHGKAKKYPPPLRIMVQETNVKGLIVGSLFLITYDGGTLGREGAHDVIIADINVSKSHLKFEYDFNGGNYKCYDLGSRNGTSLNGSRMSEAKEPSEGFDISHGSIIQIGQTKLFVCTCGFCEPGLLIDMKTSKSTATVSSNVPMLSHKEQLKLLQKKYGLQNEKFVESKGVPHHNYNDRAATRRNKVGSSTENEKTQVACVNTEIASSNKGFKMLSKLGWQKGETLGKTNASSGLLTPINVVGNEGTSGLGSEQVFTSSLPLNERKLANLKITQARFKRATDIFGESDDSDKN